MNRNLKIFIAVTGVVIAPVLLSPLPRFRKPLSTVVEARDGSLLGARIAADGQWRFPPSDTIPEKYRKALVLFEDRWFMYHPGVNPVSVVRAMAGNIKAGRIVSGGSTISMQVARLSGGSKSRTYLRKFTEALSAIKMELFYSKKQILGLYASNAPFGGNTVGIEAASWRYFGSPSSQVSWAGAALLAILPNSPSMIFPGRNQGALKAKRDRLLVRLYREGCLDSLTLTLALEEPLPGSPMPIPSLAPHLTDYFSINQPGQRIRTTIDPNMQARVTDALNNNQQRLAENRIFNSACLVTEVETGAVLAYVGNSTLNRAEMHNGNVDLVRAQRSTGSILKPLLYAAMQNSGQLLPNTLIADVPVRFQGFSPENFDKNYSGAVPASQALAQSLNIPSVNMLRSYTPARFLMLLRKVGFTSFDKEESYYGLSLILGGGEASLWELSGVYSSAARVVNRFAAGKGYDNSDYHMPNLVNRVNVHAESDSADVPLSASSLWLTFNALEKVNRPDIEAGWQSFSSSGNLAWKTGTSFGFRDAWALGTTPSHVIAVWAGNADGEGRPGLTGLTSAAPLLFDVYAMLRTDRKFAMPSGEMTTINVCKKSGMRAGPDCPESEEIWVSVSGLKTEMCKYHTILHLDETGTKRVNADCAGSSSIRNENWFVLPPAMEYYFKNHNTWYKAVPPMKPGCPGTDNIQSMEFIYPEPGTRIFIPRDETGNQTVVVAEIAHRDPSLKIYWSLDREYMTTTRHIHRMVFRTTPGKHVLTATDERGNIIRSTFSVTGSLNPETK